PSRSIPLIRNPPFRAVRIKGIDRDGRGVTARAREDLARVVQGFAEGVRDIRSKTVERANLQFVLDSVICGPGPIVADAQESEITIDAAPGGGGPGPGSRPRNRAWGHAGRNVLGGLDSQARRAGGPIRGKRGTDQRISVNGLEVAHTVVAHVASLKGDTRGNHPFHAERPLLNIGIVEIGAHSSLAACARVASARNLAQIGGLHARAGKSGRHTNIKERSRVDLGGRRGNVQVDVVVGRIIGNAVAAANDSLVLAYEPLEDARRPGKADVRSEIVQVFGDVRNFRDIRRQTGLPEPVSDVLNRDVMQEIDRLLVPFPTKTQIQGEIGPNAPVVLPVEGQVVLLEVEIEWAISKGELAAAG